ncbi:oxygen-independent coproporphyrinogen III oxidase [Chromatocurvus halotolerans]|uniref:Coproporphyrinogen-III oxidase n=1 Tax=Chromatocurvus halotolerans TaxID=1132028 RepID=A0A4R2L4Z2_9GAMM|nr:oxygen-independent coproporphyrinogen III oxidase [Chromatocurvus halotolerans]TCO77688.1 oxygen-independent coproporphyrinogen-3 oxidase [Chromatocurvus halotolerans]
MQHTQPLVIPQKEKPAHGDANIALARKYACRGPRYTSYPTAPHFSESFPRERYLDWQAETDAGTRPLSLYIHVPFCNDICYYCACNKVVTRRRGVASDYLDRLELEIAMQSKIVGDRRPITQMHWGGGTPTYLDSGEMTRLMHALSRHFALQSTAEREYAIEIDPRTVDVSTIALLKGLGFNRLSLGIQDFDPRVQRAINRIQTPESVATLVDAAREHGFRSLSFDLIYGLPFQTVDSMEESLEDVLRLRPDRIASYNYAHLPERFSSQRAIDRLALPSPEDKLRLAELIASTLESAGYLHIGMDHFVLPHDELAQAQSRGRLQRNFQGYSLRLAEDTLGLGVSAISQIGNFYLQNAPQLDSYYGLVDQGELPLRRGYEMNAEDRLRRHVIMSLICDLHLNKADTGTRFGVDFDRHFADALDALTPLAGDGLVTLGDTELRVEPAGRPFLRNICMPFDGYLAADVASGGRFSATV